MAAPRVYYAMARDGLFVKQIATVHPRFGTPALAIALQALLASFLILIGTFEQIIAYFFFVTVLFIALTVAALFVLRRKERSSVEAAAYRAHSSPCSSSCSPRGILCRRFWASAWSRSACRSINYCFAGKLSAVGDQRSANNFQLVVSF
jgi:amino acid transporter